MKNLMLATLALVAFNIIVWSLVVIKHTSRDSAAQEPFPYGEACYGVMAGGVMYPSWYPPMFYNNGLIVAEDGHKVYEFADIEGVYIDQDCLRRRYPDPNNPSHPDPLDINGDGRSDSPYYPPDDE